MLIVAYIAYIYMCVSVVVAEVYYIYIFTYIPEADTLYTYMCSRHNIYIYV